MQACLALPEYAFPGAVDATSLAFLVSVGMNFKRGLLQFYVLDKSI